tara:strand:- start:534 stop:638 length:105 start_codon:yes stop_codon:yes gene_type:complete
VAVAEDPTKVEVLEVEVIENLIVLQHLALIQLVL